MKIRQTICLCACISGTLFNFLMQLVVVMSDFYDIDVPLPKY